MDRVRTPSWQNHGTLGAWPSFLPRHHATCDNHAGDWEGSPAPPEVARTRELPRSTFAARADCRGFQESVLGARHDVIPHRVFTFHPRRRKEWLPAPHADDVVDREVGG